MISGKMRLDVVAMDLGDVIDAAVETILPAASAKDIGIHVAVDPRAARWRAIATRLQQAVWNLLSNAVKFTAAGGRVDVRTRVNSGQIELTVADSGIGIEAAFLPVRVRALPPGGRLEHPCPHRPRSRPRDRSTPRRASRRNGAGGERRPRCRNTVRHAAATEQTFPHRPRCAKAGEHRRFDSTVPPMCRDSMASGS